MRNRNRGREISRASALAGLVAFAGLIAFFLRGDAAREVLGRAALLRRSAAWDLPRRRLEGSAAAYDRRFAALVLAAREALPPGTRGVALYAPAIPEWGGLYSAIYELAPVPVVVAPPSVRPGWVALTYGTPPAPALGLREIRRLEGGALLAPP
jgi:hypothetical protein